MRILIIGAGASYAEGLRCGLPEELCPPLISNFAKKLWSDYSPTELLSTYLLEEGYQPREDPRELFFQLEQTSTSNVNIERFFEFAYTKRSLFPGAYENLLYHGILNPLVFLLMQGLWKGGDITKCPLPCAQSVARHLRAGDVVVSLNYDTLFEIGALQAGHQLVFLPNELDREKVAICKPHGSLNLVIDEERSSFCFGKLNWPGSPQPANGSKNFIGFIPPRLNKSYREHWVSFMILQPTKKLSPQIVTFWGVGLTESDTDLLELYKNWGSTADSIEFINPSEKSAQVAQELFDKKLNHFVHLTDWEAKQDEVPS